MNMYTNEHELSTNEQTNPTKNSRKPSKNTRPSINMYNLSYKENVLSILWLLVANKDILMMLFFPNLNTAKYYKPESWVHRSVVITSAIDKSLLCKQCSLRRVYVIMKYPSNIIIQHVYLCTVDIRGTSHFPVGEK